MSCHEYGNLTICRPHVDAWSRFYARCPNCRQRRLIFSEFQDYYGSRNTCLKRGREWMGGEPLKRIKSLKQRVEARQSARSRIAKYVSSGIAPGFARWRERLEREVAARNEVRG